MRKILGGLVLVMVLAASCGGDSGGGEATGGTPGVGAGGQGGMPATSGGTDEQAIRALAPAACERLRACYPDVYAQAYPGGAPGCLEATLATEPPSKLGQPSPCSVADGQACIADLATFACPGLMQNTLPSSCQKCDISKTPQSGPNGSMQQVLGFTVHALCRKAQSCNPQGFAQTYPTGVQACVAQSIGALSAAVLAQVSTCTDAAAAACSADLKAASCESLGMNKLPTSCGGCL